MSLGQRIYEQRTAHDLSQVDLADLLEVSRQSVSKWETDASVPELDKLVKMCEVFGVSLDQLVLGKVPSPPPPAVRPSVLSQKNIGLALAALGLLAFILMAIVTQDITAGVFLALPFLACGGLCSIVRKRPLLFLCCGWVICISLLFYFISEDDLVFLLDAFIYGSPDYFAQGLLAFLDVVGLLVLLVTSLMYGRIFPSEDKKTP